MSDDFEPLGLDLLIEGYTRTKMTSSVHYKPPDVLKIHGASTVENWRQFKEQWDNYEVAVNLTDESKEKPGAIFLT